MKNAMRGLSLAVVAVLLSVTPAYSHPWHLPAAGFTAGLAHPFGGLDHLLAMLAVGMLAWQRSGRSLTLLPACFVAFAGLGWLVGDLGLSPAFTQEGVVLSVVLLGGLVAVAPRCSWALVTGLVAASALLHGAAHGAELVAGPTAALGFLTGTLLLHTGGLAAGRLLGDATLRLAGSAIVVSGILLLAPIW